MPIGARPSGSMTPASEAWQDLPFDASPRRGRKVPSLSLTPTHRFHERMEGFKELIRRLERPLCWRFPLISRGVSSRPTHAIPRRSRECPLVPEPAITKRDNGWSAKAPIPAFQPQPWNPRKPSIQRISYPGSSAHPFNWSVESVTIAARSMVTPLATAGCSIFAFVSA